MRLVADYDATVNLRPVYPLAVRVPGFFKRANPQFARYVVLDSSRVAQHENIPFRFPRPDPIVQNMATLDVAEHQPYIHRLTRLGAAAQIEGRSLVFVDAISRALWDDSVKGWNEGDHLARAAAAAGSIWPRWTPPLQPTPIATSGSSRTMKMTTRLPAIGACLLSCSRTSRSSDRTGSTF